MAQESTEKNCRVCLHYGALPDREPCLNCRRNKFAPDRDLQDDRFEFCGKPEKPEKTESPEIPDTVMEDDSDLLDEEIAHWEMLAEAYEFSDDTDGTGQYLDTEPAKECHRLLRWLRELKSLREENRWIPVTERLPKKGGYYLVTMKISEDVYLTGEKYLSKKEKKWNTSHPVVAWRQRLGAYRERRQP